MSLNLTKAVSRIPTLFIGLTLGVVFTFSVNSGSVAHAFDLDWSGQFWAEDHMVRGYALDSANVTPDAARVGKGGYYIPGGGDAHASFQTLFLRLKPKVIVNDNLFIKSEWWAGDPLTGFFGSGYPYGIDQRQFYSNQSRGSALTVQRVWAELLTDVGVVQVGRAPLHWGLGLVWNSGDKLYDRYQTTGDTVRLLSKFGAFTFSPAFIKYSTGNNIGGACTGAVPCTPIGGFGGLNEYSLVMKYENPDEDFEGGVNFVRRVSGAAQDPIWGTFGALGAPASLNYNVWDIYGKKKWGGLSFGAEVPITAGDIGGIPYKTFALATEADWKINSSFETYAKFGLAPGQPNDTSATPAQIKSFYFNPNYKMGMMMFNYQFANFAGPNTSNNPGNAAAVLRSPYDNPITNATYYSFGGAYHLDKWDFSGLFSFANAQQAAVDGQFFYNTWEKKFYADASGLSQKTFLGWEMDYGIGLRWDDNFTFNFDLGWYFPGAFYKFSNTAVENPISSVFGAVLKAGIQF